MRLLNVYLLSFFLFFSGCGVVSKLNKTPLEIQIMQTRDYEFEKSVVFSSVMSVFQDLGYIVKSADENTGFITAVSATKSDNSSLFLFGISSVMKTSATAYIEKIGNIVKMRLSFVNNNKTSSGNGQTNENDTPIVDAKIYENAFDRIENAIFMRKSN